MKFITFKKVIKKILFISKHLFYPNYFGFIKGHDYITKEDFLKLNLLVGQKNNKVVNTKVKSDNIEISKKELNKEDNNDIVSLNKLQSLEEIRNEIILIMFIFLAIKKIYMTIYMDQIYFCQHLYLKATL